MESIQGVISDKHRIDPIKTYFRHSDQRQIKDAYNYF